VPADSPKNILGSRWLGLSEKSYGIHGTTEPQSIGRQVTSGCVRMRNSDVEELYQIVPEGTEVVIID
jgi:lipoprotein-anchoring transpeptidase ErfK/SrfK